MLDASAVAAWFVPGQRTDAADALLSEAHQHAFEAPHIFPVEVRNLLLKLERRGRLGAVSTTRALETLALYNLTVDAAPDTATHDVVLLLARREGLSVYDGLYLWQAMREGIVLASRDGALLAAAQRRSIEIRDLRM